MSPYSRKDIQSTVGDEFKLPFCFIKTTDKQKLDITWQDTYRQSYEKSLCDIPSPNLDAGKKILNAELIDGSVKKRKAIDVKVLPQLPDSRPLIRDLLLRAGPLCVNLTTALWRLSTPKIFP